ncbi:ATP12 family chaperone protein [Marivita hallyeonensis]|uniref:Chaperone required for the assembly of the F1-ATPase n=1 Tax=Marivita hallyeonensis TaxID=996342 RepID=A0A1M5N5S2_9RHOB|nr:ATP12 family protein [Marivita hallyeonensis]SHG84807.1 Chaperone required for the assembly of the F1-ATPase [Marivita hallyeonensis]
MSEWAPKRFWKTTETTQVEGGFGILLDGRPVRTPAKAALYVPSAALASKIAIEFDAQEDRIDPTTMPFTRTANAAVDKVMLQHAEVADMLADYGDSDLLCYRADAPEELVERQNAQWDPLLDWAADALDARLETRTGVIHAAQDQAILSRLRERVHALSAFELAAFHDLVSISGSLVIGFAAKMQHRNPEELWTISRLDEIWQEDQWGEDEEAAEMALVKKDAFLHAADFMRLIES